MKRFFWILTLTFPLAAQTPTLSLFNALLPLLTKCSASAASPLVLEWNGATLLCVTPSALGIGTPVHNEIPAGSVNGTNATFTLANSPISGTQEIYVNGIRMCPGATSTATCGTGGPPVDYVISGNTITFNSPSIPQTGDTILADYSH